MTREEAIAELSVLHERLSNPKDCEDGCYSWEDGWYVEAIDMAIEALSAETNSDDLIIRGAKGIQDGLYNIKDGKLFKYKARGGTVRVYEIVTSAEAVQGEWIECLVYNPDLDADVLYIECDQCGHRPYFSGSYRPKYCEDCGANMKGEMNEA